MTLTGWNVFTQKDGNAPLLTGLSGTAKPTGMPDKWLLFETDTGKGYYSSGGAWVLATSGGGGTVTAVTASAPLASSGGTTPDISLTVPSDATKFLDGTGAFDTVKDSDLSTSNITTNNVTIAKHGFAPILPNDATKYLDGTGAYTVPAGTGTGTVTTTGSPASGNLTKFTGATSISNADLTGDVTTSGTVATTIANDAVTYAKMQNAAANTIIARAASSSGDLSEVGLAASQLAGRGSTGDIAAIALGTGLSMSGTTVSATGAGGRNPNDPLTSSYIFDDFQRGSNSSPGSLDWANSGSGVSVAFLASEANHPGIFEYASAGSNINAFLYANGTTNAAECRFADTFDAYFIFRFFALTNCTFRFGFFEIAESPTADPPANGIYFEFKTASDTNVFGVTRAASAETRTDMTVAASTNFVRFRIRRTDASTITFSMDGTNKTATTNIPTGSCRVIVQLHTTSGANAYDMDFHDLLVTGITR